MKQQFSALLDTRMNRKDFLKYMAAASVMAMGGNLILQSLNGANRFGLSSSKSNPKVGTGFSYGSSVYGGDVSGDKLAPRI